ncbi:MAG TPA: hypothetical protein VFR35_19905, partial [Actinoplanes sp.]|nr:hypothetical protein [Actinoplanes sp.]
MGARPRVEHAMPVTAVVIALLVVAEFPAPSVLGSTGSPLGPGGGAIPAVRWLALGLLAAPAVMVYAHRWAAAWGAV